MTSGPVSSRPSLNEHLVQSGAPDPLRHLILDIAKAAKYIQFALRTTEAGLAGKKNQFGEEQEKLDVLSDEIIAHHLKESRTVASFCSEERDQIIELDSTAPYSVAYDPLDGSSLVDANFAIGSIFGIYGGNTFLERTPRHQVAALYVLYGPRTLLVYAASDGAHMFILNEVGEFILLRENLGIGDSAKTYSLGNVSAAKDNKAFATVFQSWIEGEMTLRYSGCMVADVHHILSKGQGIFANVAGGKYPQGKLRLLFECGPFAHIVEQAGGKASTGSGPLLDTKITSLDQRSPIIIGSQKEVKRLEEALSH